MAPTKGYPLIHTIYFNSFRTALIPKGGGYILDRHYILILPLYNTLRLDTLDT